MKRESKAERKFNLLRRLQDMGFTYEESWSLRRIEMTLSRWAEAECNGDIQRNETTGLPYRHFTTNANYVGKYPVADREAGAIKRLKAIVDARNERETVNDGSRDVIPYHQGDPRGCALYLVKTSDLPADYFAVVWCGDGYSVARKQVGSGENKNAYSCRFPKAEDAQALADAETLSAFYTRGLAVCA